MASSVWVSEAFEADLRSILDYYRDELGMPSEACHFMEEVDEAKELIAEVPLMHSISGKAGLRERGCREHFVRGYALVYRIEAEGTVFFCVFSISLSSQAGKWSIGVPGSLSECG